MKGKSVSEKTVIVLHPSDELKLIEFGKKCLEVTASESGSKIFSMFPLWGIIENVEGQSPSLLSKKISGLVYDGQGTDGSALYIRLRLFMKDGTEKSIRIDFLKKAGEGTGNLQVPSFEPELDLRIFRICNACFEGNSYFINDSSWVKLKNL